MRPALPSKLLGYNPSCNTLVALHFRGTTPHAIRPALLPTLDEKDPFMHVLEYSCIRPSLVSFIPSPAIEHSSTTRESGMENLLPTEGLPEKSGIRKAGGTGTPTMLAYASSGSAVPCVQASFIAKTGPSIGIFHVRLSPRFGGVGGRPLPVRLGPLVPPAGSSPHCHPTGPGVF
ncbi:hypothetical protein C7212DRAFT_345207 [Tuber magnatum]|uniref:Uncharacterized protein n=1 Tax=Tuber magnatum TaxID=42249 RepID=A0A317SPZ6_9PEZI|nr:hypothetical protein C7212DRAFT_345207 [Tuber magnatum]